MSVGIGVYPDDGADAETLLKNADLALFQAKAEGRGKRHSPAGYLGWVRGMI